MLNLKEKSEREKRLFMCEIAMVRHMVGLLEALHEGNIMGVYKKSEHILWRSEEWSLHKIAFMLESMD